MATILKVKRLSGNPRRRTARRTKRNVSRRRTGMSPKQISIFGTKRQKAALKASRRRKRASGVGSVTRRRRRKNSALVVTLGAAPGLAGLNPRRRRRKNVARARRTASGKFAPARRRRSSGKRRTSRKRYSNPRRRRSSSRRRRASNPVRRHRRRRNRTVFVSAPRRRRRRASRSNPRRRRHNRRHYAHRSRSRRNPTIMGHSLTSKNALKLIGGGLLGVAAVKFIPRMIPAGLIPGGGSPYVTVLVTGVSAVLAGWLIGKVDRELGDGATFGGLMVAGSQLINAVAPGLSIAGVPLGLSGGLGDLMPGQFSVPQNPLRLPPPPPQPAGARVSMSGLARAYGSAF